MMTVLTLLTGVVAGVVALMVVLYFVAPGMMLSERKSPFSLEKTVSTIEKAAIDQGWVVSSIAELDQSVKKHGGPDVRPVRLINLCQSQHSGKILLDDTARFVSVLMPCTISVYEKSDDSVWVGSMNPGLMGRVFGGVISEVMAGPVAKQQAKILSSVR